jgi:hypothetical protein
MPHHTTNSPHQPTIGRQCRNRFNTHGRPVQACLLLRSPHKITHLPPFLSATLFLLLELFVEAYFPLGFYVCVRRNTVKMVKTTEQKACLSTLFPTPPPPPRPPCPGLPPDTPGPAPPPKDVPLAVTRRMGALVADEGHQGPLLLPTLPATSASSASSANGSGGGGPARGASTPEENKRPDFLVAFAYIVIYLEVGWLILMFLRTYSRD